MNPLGIRLLFILAALAVWRILAAAHLGMELHADEAQYWSWSLAPDWGYYSKPPMVAWAIWLGTRLFGDSELGIRALTEVTYPVTALVLYLLVRRLFRGDPKAEVMAFWTALLFATLPFVTLYSWLMTTDAFLVLFWSLSLLLLVTALESGRWRDWLLLGAALGLGLLSKFSMVFFGLSAAAYLVLSPEQRRWLRNPRPYAAAMLAFVILLPNILWNAHHHFVSYHHTAEISQLDRSLFHPGALLEFFLAQFAVFGPLTFSGLILLAARPRRWLADDRLRLLAAFVYVPLLAFLALSLLSRAFANWAAFAYASGITLVVASWLSQGRQRWLVATLVVHLVLAVGIYHAHDLTRALGIQLSRNTDPYSRVTGHRELGAQVASRLMALPPDTRLLVDDRKLFALLRYYARPHSDSARYLNPSGNLGNHFALTVDVRDAPKGRFLLVTRGDLAGQLPKWFASVTPQAPIRIAPYPDYTMSFNTWLLENYTGP